MHYGRVRRWRGAGVLLAAGAGFVVGCGGGRERESVQSDTGPQVTNTAPWVGSGCEDAEPGSATDLTLEPAYIDIERLHRWTGPDGCPVRLDYLMTRDGPEHCGWQDSQDLVMGTPLGAPQSQDVRIYVRDPLGVLGVPALQEAFDPEAELPEDAADTGYRLGEVELWMTPATDFAYLVDDATAERWPLAPEPPGCA